VTVMSMVIGVPIGVETDAEGVKATENVSAWAAAGDKSISATASP